MIHLTILIYINEGQEEAFEQYESIALGQLPQYSGELLLRVRPTPETFIDGSGETPYEIHYLTFASEEDFKNYLADDKRKEADHLREQSFKKVVLTRS